MLACCACRRAGDRDVPASTAFTALRHLQRAESEEGRESVRQPVRLEWFHVDCKTALPGAWRCGLTTLQWVNNTYPAGLGEPLNIILAGDSDPDVLNQSTDNGGFLNYML